MKLSFSRSDLVSAIQTVQSSVSTKSTLPILSNLLLRVEKSAKGNIVKMEATDLEVGVRCSLKAEVLEEGKVTLPAKKFGDLVREMPEGHSIEIATKDGRRVELRCGKVKASLVSLPPEDFPLIPVFPDGKSFKLERTVFQEMLKKTCFAVSNDETRYVLNGILFLLSGGELRMVATDGRRLAYITRNGAQKDLSASVIIPSKAIAEILRLLSGQTNPQENWIQVAPYENQVSFKWNDRGEEVVLVSRVIDGTFPNYEQVIPKTKEIEIQVKTPEILSAVRRAALFAQDRGGSVRISLSPGRLKISANSQTVGEEEEDMDIVYEGANFDIAFNPQFLLDILKNSDSPVTRFEFSSSLNPGLVKPAENDSYLCVIMPMRLQ